MVKTGEQSLLDVYNSVKNTLCAVTEDAAFEAKELLQWVFGVSRTDILLGKTVRVTDEAAGRLEALVQKRLSRYPLQYLLGEWDFYGRTFAVGEGVLIPRADTEPLVEACLGFLKGIQRPRVLDLCSGSGCIALTLALERPDAAVFGVEKDPAAFSYFQKNNARYQNPVRGILGDALSGETAEGEFDLIVSNPPYLTRKEMEELQPEVRYEPALALYGEEDGLFFYRELTRIWSGRLKPGGMLAFEIGMGQEKETADILSKYCLKSVCQYRDLHGIIRVMTGRR